MNDFCQDPGWGLDKFERTLRLNKLINQNLGLAYSLFKCRWVGIFSLFFHFYKKNRVNTLTPTQSGVEIYTTSIIETDWFSGFLHTSFIFWILMKNLNDDFCIFRGPFYVVVIYRKNKANDQKMANFGNLVDLNRSLVN